MRCATFPATVLLLATPMAVVADLSSSSVTCSNPVNSATITIDATGNANPSTSPCLAMSATVTFSPAASNRFVVILGKNNPFQNGSVVMFNNDNNQGTVSSGGGTLFNYISCGSSGSGFACKDPKIIINPNQLGEVLVYFGRTSKKRELTVIRTDAPVTVKPENQGPFQALVSCAEKPCKVKVSFDPNQGTGSQRFLVTYQFGPEVVQQTIVVTGEKE